MEILRSLGVDLPESPFIREENATFNTRPSDDLARDLVLIVGPPQQPLCGIVIEPQGDKSKNPVQMARYAAAGWLHLKCPFHVLVVSSDPKVIEYYTRPVETALPGYVFQAWGYGPDNVPVITDPEQVSAHPVAAAFGIAVHGHDPAVRRAYRLGSGLIPEEYRTSYTEYTMTITPRNIRWLLEGEMNPTDWPVVSSFAKEHFGKGEIEGATQALLVVLEARGLTVTEEARERVTSCTDLDQLKAWTTKAVTAESIDEVFD